MIVLRVRVALVLALAGCRAADDATARTDFATIDAGADAPHDAASEQTGMVFEHCIDGAVVTSPYTGVQSTRCDVSVSGVACVAEGACPVLCGPASCSASCVCEKGRACVDHGADAPSCLRAWNGALDCSTGDLVVGVTSALLCTSDGWAYFAGPADAAPACDPQGTWAIAYTPMVGTGCFGAAPTSLGIHRSGTQWTVAFGTPAGNHTTQLSADGCTLAVTILKTLPFTPGGETGAETMTVKLSFANGAGTWSRQGNQFCIGGETGTLVVTKK